MSDASKTTRRCTKKTSAKEKHSTREGSATASERPPAEPKERPPEATRLYLTKTDGETDKQAFARHAVLPEVNAATTISVLSAPGFSGPELDLTTLVGELQSQSEAVNDGRLVRGESMLAAQAQTLDAMFHFLTRKALAQGHLQQYDTYMRLALKAQSQCRTSWESISEIKNPRSVFVKQANIANGHQQINNASARELESSPTKLLETTRNEWMDARATSKAGRGNQTLEAVGAINGTAQ